MAFSIDWPLFFSTFGLIFLAELPDKTAIACLLLGTRNSPIAVFIGVAVAFAIQSLVSVLAGQVLAMAPERLVHIGAGVLFLVFAFFFWRDRHESVDEATPVSKTFWKSVGTSFLIIFVAEWGDLTQLATATLQAKYHSGFTIFCASTAALWTVSAIGISIGYAFQSRLPTRRVNVVAAVIFALVGVYFIVEGLR